MGEGASLPTVWRHAIADPEAGLTPTQKLVAFVIGAHMNGTGEAWPSVGTIAAECDLHAATVQRARSVLVARGLLVVDQGGGRSKTNRYRAAIPPHQRDRLAEKGSHQRTETPAPASRNPRRGATRSLQEVTKEGASPFEEETQEQKAVREQALAEAIRTTRPSWWGTSNPGTEEEAREARADAS
jgi:DNA-binding transcriptional MocR family regulator